MYYTCDKGHELTKSLCRPQKALSINAFDFHWTQKLKGESATLSDYLQSMFPRRSVGPDIGGTTVLHRLPGYHCPHLDCVNAKNQSMPLAINAHWPQILHIIPKSRNDGLVPKGHLHVERTFTLTEPEGDDTVEYEMVGRIYFVPGMEHWKTEMIIGSSMFAYDDMQQNGSLVEVGPDSLMDEANYQIALLVYHRKSSSNTVGTVSFFLAVTG